MVSLNVTLLGFVIFIMFLFISQAQVEALSVESITEITDPAIGIGYGGAKFSPDGTKIAAVSDRGLEVMDLDGSNKQVIVKDKYVFSYSWSPDGTKIAFTNVSGKKGDIRNIWVVNVDGTSLEQVTFGKNDIDPTWSPDGIKVAFCRGEGFNWFQRKHRRSIWTVDVDGTNLDRITPYGDDFSQPAFSPDGTKIACVSNLYSRDSGIWIMSNKGDNPVEVIKILGVASPKWSTDGKKLWIETKIVNIDGTNPVPLVIDHKYSAPILSPDWKLVCDAIPKGGEKGASQEIVLDSQLYIFDRELNSKFQITDEPGIIYFPTDWSSDGLSVLATKSPGPEREQLPKSLVLIKLKNP